MLGGVCVAVARSTGTDPVLWRVLVAVLAVFGGTGLVLYAAGLLLIPLEGDRQSTAERWLRGRDSTTPTALALVVVGAVLLLLVTNAGEGLVPLAVVGLLAFLALRRRQDGPAPASAVPGPASYDGQAYAPHGPFTAAAPLPLPPLPPRSGSLLGPLTVCAALVVVGALLAARASGLDGVTASHVLTAALVVVGLGLVVGARFGRSRGLVVLGIALAVALGGARSVEDAVDGSVGERTWVVTGPAVERLGLGEAVLDLTQVPAGTEAGLEVVASVGVGELLVLVPEDLTLELDASVGLGELDVDGSESEAQGGTSLDSQTRLGPAGPVDITLDAGVGVGQLEVRRVPS